MSLRRRDRIDDLIQACELRREKAETLKQQKKFSWGKAATALRNHRKPIKKVADLMKVKKLGSDSIKGELVEVLTNQREVVPDPPTASQLKAAGNKTAPREYKPQPRSGAEAILKALLELGGDWHEFTTVQNEAKQHSEFSMFSGSGTNGRTAWTGSKTLEEKHFVEKNMRNKRYNGNRFGNKKALIRLTDFGRTKAVEW
jgi:hypothetical protein